jgi:hypothetical protein
VITSWQTLAAADPSLAEPDQYDVGLRPGLPASGYVRALAAKLGTSYRPRLGARQHPEARQRFRVGVAGQLAAVRAGWCRG